MFSKFSTPVKYMLTFIALIVIVAILLFGVLPAGIKWHLSKDQVINTISKTIGRTVQITGKTTVSLFPHVGITITDVRVLSPMGSYNSNLAIIPKVHVGVSISQILRGNIYSIDNISLYNPKIYITNDTEKGESPLANLTDTLFSISKLGFTHLNITNGTLVISNYISKSENSINGINTNLGLKKDSLNGLITLNWKGLDIALHGNMYRTGSKSSIYTLVDFNLLNGALTGRLDSRISDALFKANSIKAHIKVNSTDKLLSELNLSSPPVALDIPLDINLELKESNDKSWASSKFTINSLSQVTNGKISYVPLKEEVSDAQINIQTTSKNFDINSLISYINTIHPEDNNPNLGKDVLIHRISAITPISSRSALVNNMKNPVVKKTKYKVSWVLPKHLDINIENKASTINILNATAKDFILKAKVQSNEILIKEASASFPGDASFKLFGFIHSSKGEPMLDGTILFNSNNPTNTLKWLGIQAKTTTNNELNASFRTNVLMDSHKLQLKSLVFNMGSLNFKGSLTKSFTNDQELHMAGSFSTIPFDDWVPYIIQTISSVENNSFTGGLSKVFSQEAFDSPTSIKLISTDATLSGIALKDVNLDLSIDQGDLKINHFKAMPIGDGSISVQGQIDEIFSDPNFNNVIIKANLKDSANALDSNILPSNIPANAVITIDGGVKNTNADMIFSYSTMKGRIRTGGSWQTGVMYPMVLNLSDDNVNNLLNTLGYTNIKPNTPSKELALSAVIKRSQLDGVYNLSELDATIGKSDIDGNITLDTTKEIPNLAMNLNTEEFSYDILKNIYTKKPQAVVNYSVVKHVDNNVQTDTLKIQDNENVDNLNIANPTDTPTTTDQATSNNSTDPNTDPNTIANAPTTDQALNSAPANPTAINTVTANSNDNTVINVNDYQPPLIKLMQNLNMDLKLNVKKFYINKTYIENVSLKANAVSGIFSLDNTELNFASYEDNTTDSLIKPTASIQFTWDTNTAMPTSSLTWTTDNIDIETILPKVGIQGQFTSKGNIKGYGYNIQQIFDNINGNGNVSFSNIQYLGRKKPTTLAPLGSIYDILTLINNKQSPYSFSSPFDINTGLLKFSNGTISNSLVKGTLDGIVNLEKSQIQANGLVTKGSSQHWFTLRDSLVSPSKTIDNK